MADLNDLFGGAAALLTARAADSGGTWSRMSWDSINNVPSINGSGAINVTDFCSVMVNSDVGSSGDGVLSMPLSDNGNFLTRITLFARAQADNTCVGGAIRFDGGLGVWKGQIETRDASGNATAVGTEDTITWDRYQTGTVSLDCSGGTVALKLDGTTLVSRTGVGITAAGRNGFISRDMNLNSIAWASAGGGGTPVGLATETDTALALVAKQIGTVGLATETDTALALTTAVGFDFHTAAGLIFGDLAGALTGLAREASVSMVLRVYAVASPGSLVHESGTLTTGSNGRLPRFTHSSLSLGTNYHCMLIRASDGEIVSVKLPAT